MILITILAFVIILSILVLIHELGHFLVAKKLGIKVEEFGFGFPPRVWGIKRGETLYSINLLPVGGFVKLYGEDDAGGGKLLSTNTEIRKKKNSEQDRDVDLKRAFFARSAWQRIAVVIAGVLMNFVLAVLLISYLFSTQGVALPGKTLRIVEVVKNSPAQMQGLKAGDEVVLYNNKKITEASKFITETKNNLGKPLKIILRRDGKEFSLTITPRKNSPKDQGALGVAISNTEIRKYVWYEAPFYGTIEAAKFSLLIIQGLGGMVSDLVLHGVKPKGVAGPVGVAQLTGQAVSYGLNATLWFMALLSLNLAVLNILPIPALDGGRLFFIIIEVVTGKKVNSKYESYAHAAGLAILLSLMLFITIFDVVRLLSGKPILPQ